MHQTSCATVLYAPEVAPIVHALVASNPELQSVAIPSFQEMLESQSPTYPFEKDFSNARDEPVVILHSSGSTG